MIKIIIFFSTISILLSYQNKPKKPNPEACKKLQETFFTYSPEPEMEMEIYVERYLDGKQIQHRVYKIS